MKRRAVVSGANGFVGSAVVRSLLENDYEVYALVHSSRANLPEDKNLFVMQYDGSQTTMEIPEADYFFHFAWEGMTGKKRSDIGVQMGNLEMTRNAMKLAKNTGCRRFIGCGSIMEDESMAGINNPEFLPSPGHIYGFVKMLCRYYCKMYAIENGMGYVCGRLTNTYGPGEVSNRLICDLIRCLLNGNPKELSS